MKANQTTWSLPTANYTLIVCECELATTNGNDDDGNDLPIHIILIKLTTYEKEM